MTDTGQDMKRTIRNVVVIANYSKNDVEAVIRELHEYFKKINASVHVFGYNETIPHSILSNADIAFSLGGDGTLLYTSRLILETHTPVLGVNLGTFGFLAEVSKDEWIKVYEKFVAGNLSVSERLMAKITLMREGTLVSVFHGLNEAVVHSCGISRLMDFTVYFSDTHIGRYRADGVIVATPTGSTAYSLAAGGPIIHPEMEAWILNPICPFTLTNRPIVIPGDEIVRIELDRLQRTELILTVDGQETVDLLPGDLIYIEKSESKTHIINSDKRDFYGILKSKLNWSGEPYARRT
jgi:NAD+ kinase